MRLRSEHGEIVEGRCRSTNLCRYCQTLFVVETLEMLALDAAEWAPTLWLVLTAREHLSRRDTYAHLQQLRRAARRRWPDIEWFVQVEFQRRGALHLNLVVKGVPVEDRAKLEALFGRLWCERVDAEQPAAVWSGEVSDGEGLMRYLHKHLAHGLKREQAPPIGWRGHRTSQTRGYLVRPAPVMRAEARASLRLKRELRKALARGFEGHDAELVAQQAAQLAADTSWELYRLPIPCRQLTPVERAREAHSVPAFIVEAALRWDVASSTARDLADRWGVELEAITPELVDAYDSWREHVHGSG
jgi:hypothetical protein